jgi:hypothetical protein
MRVSITEQGVGRGYWTKVIIGPNDDIEPRVEKLLKNSQTMNLESPLDRTQLIGLAE